MNIPKYTQLYRNELKLKNYSENTIKNYSCQVELLLRNHNGQFTEPSKLTSNQSKIGCSNLKPKTQCVTRYLL